MEQYRVHFLKSAKTDMYNIGQYISEQLSAPRVALRKVDTIENKIKKKLYFWPQKHRLIDNTILASKGLRMMNVEGRIAFFFINEKKKIVKVWRIIHSKRDWANLLSENSSI